jgi:hypothetical protein
MHRSRPVLLAAAVLALPACVTATATATASASTAPRLTAVTGAPATVSPTLAFGVKYTIKGAGTATLTGRLGNVALSGSAKVKVKRGKTAKGTLRLTLNRALPNGSKQTLKLCVGGKTCRTVRTVTIRPRATGALPGPKSAGAPVAAAGVAPAAPATPTTPAPPSGGGPTNPQPGAPAVLDLKAPANPVTVDPTPDTARAVTKTLDTMGGTIEADGPHGEHYKLDVPYGALLAPIAITLTPLKGVAGLPFSGGLVAGARLAPDGLRFTEPVRLTITGAPAVSSEAETGFGYRGDGRELAMVPMVKDAHVQAFDLMHFSAYGIASATEADRRAQLIRQTTDVEGRLSQLLANELQVDRNWQISGRGRRADQATMESAMRQYNDEVLGPLMQAALTDINVVPRALSKFLGWDRQLQMFFGKDFMKAERDARMQDFLNVVKAAAQHYFNKCLSGDPNVLPIILNISRQLQLLGLDDPSLEVLDKCARFELDLETTIDQSNQGQKQTFHGHLTVDKMVFSLAGRFQEIGAGTWHQDSFTILPKGAPDVGCWLDTSGFEPTGVTSGLIQMDVNWIEDVDGGEYQLHEADIADIRLAYAPMITREEVHWGFCGGSTGQGGVRTWLGVALGDLHEDEKDPGMYGWVIKNWTRPNLSSFVLKKDYQRTKMIDNYPTTESTHITLRHAPLQ